MPFKSEAQRRYLFAEHPDIAERWAKEYPRQKRLPAHLRNNRNKSRRLANKKK